MKNVVKFRAETIKKDINIERPKIQDWEDILSFMEKHHAAISNAIEKSKLRRKKIDEQISLLRRRLSDIQGYKRKETIKITVALKARTSGNWTLKVEYIIPNCQWRPYYDARADLEHDRVNISYRAMVSQRTGEDWDHVNLTLSTARPAVGTRMPGLKPWKLREKKWTYRARRAIRSLARDFEKAAGSAAPSAIKMEKQLYEAAPVAAQVSTASAERSGSSVTFRIPGKTTIKGDNTQTRTTVAVLDLDADFSYETTAKLTQHVYLAGKMKNTSEFPLLAGPVSIFMGGQFTGKGRIDLMPTGAETNLFFGVDDRISVKREPVRDLSGKSGIMNKKQRKRQAWRIVVRNHKKRPVTVRLWDQVPISMDKRITVKLTKSQPSPDGYDNPRNDPELKTARDKGFLHWDLEIGAGRSKTVEFEYYYEYPKKLTVTD